MDAVSLMLRQAREDRGLSLEDVARTTRIPLSTLTAIEDGDRTGLPAPIYVRGFVRAFARAVGVDPEEAVRALPGMTPPATSPHADAVGEPERFDCFLGGGRRRSSTHLSPGLAIGPVILLLVGLGMFLAAWLLVGTRTGPSIETAAPERPAIQDSVDGVSSYTRQDVGR